MTARQATVADAPELIRLWALAMPQISRYWTRGPVEPMTPERAGELLTPPCRGYVSDQGVWLAAVNNGPEEQLTLWLSDPTGGLLAQARRQWRGGLECLRLWAQDAASRGVTRLYGRAHIAEQGAIIRLFDQAAQRSAAGEHQGARTEDGWQEIHFRPDDLLRGTEGL